jgi:betaine-aldehyde dehydrogenase
MTLGSVPTARRVMSAAAAGPRAVSLELGGKSPLIIFEDANIEATVDWVITGFLWGSGQVSLFPFLFSLFPQVCSSTSRVLVHSSVREAFMKLLIEKVSAVKIGDSLSTEMADCQGGQMGPVVNDTQHQKVWAYIDEARSQGLVFAYGGTRELVASINEGKGYFIPPTIIADPPLTARVWNEEIFGPVLCVREFNTEEEAVTVANDSIYGLAAAVFSADLDRCERISRRLRTGIVWKNNCQPAFIQAPWGGCKQSGFGRDLGRWGLEEFTNVKQVTSSAPGYQWGLW